MASVGEILRVLQGRPDSGHSVERVWGKVQPKLEALDLKEAQAKAIEVEIRSASIPPTSKSWVSGRPHHMTVQEAALDGSNQRQIPVRRP